MKYIDAEKLIVEIERQKSLFSTEKEKEGLSKTDKLSLGARIASLEETIVLITSLQQEQQKVDLEEEIAIYLRTFSSSFENGIEYAKNIVRHFYELGLNARKEE